MILLVCRNLAQVERAESIWNDKTKFKAVTIGSPLIEHQFDRAIFLFDPYAEPIQNTTWTAQELVDCIQIKLRPNAEVEFL